MRVFGGEMEMPGTRGEMAVFLKFEPEGGNGMAAEMLKGRMGHGSGSRASAQVVKDCKVGTEFIQGCCREAIGVNSGLLDPGWKR